LKIVVNTTWNVNQYAAYKYRVQIFTTYNIGYTVLQI
jgi:hypothetical protein